MFSFPVDQCKLLHLPGVVRLRMISRSAASSRRNLFYRHVHVFDAFPCDQFYIDSEGAGAYAPPVVDDVQRRLDGDAVRFDDGSDGRNKILFQLISSPAVAMLT